MGVEVAAERRMDLMRMSLMKTSLMRMNLMRTNLKRTNLKRTSRTKTNLKRTSRTKTSPTRSQKTSRAPPRASARPRQQHISLHSATSSRKLQGPRMDLPHLALPVLPQRSKSRKVAQSEGPPPRNSTAARRRRPLLTSLSTVLSRFQAARRTLHAPRRSARCSRAARSMPLPRL